MSADDPVKAGIVASFNRPGGNATGIYLFTSILETKRLALLHELTPTASVIAVLINPTSTLAKAQAVDVQAAARNLGRKIRDRESGGASGNSRQHLRPLPSCDLARSSLPPIRFSTVAAITQWHRWRATPSQRSTRGGILHWPVA